MVEQTQGQHKTTVPELQWHIDLHGPVHLGPASPSAGAGKGAFTAVADRGQQQHSPVKPDSSADPAGRRAPLASEDRPATAADICRRNLDPGPLQRSASADIGWRMPQQPKPSRSSQEASRPGRTAPVAGVAASKAATQSGQRSRAGAGQAASRPAQDCQPHAQPSAAAVQESDPASLRRCASPGRTVSASSALSILTRGRAEPRHLLAGPNSKLSNPVQLSERQRHRSPRTQCAVHLRPCQPRHALHHSPAQPRRASRLRPCSPKAQQLREAPVAAPPPLLGSPMTSPLYKTTGLQSREGQYGARAVIAPLLQGPTRSMSASVPR